MEKDRHASELQYVKQLASVAAQVALARRKKSDPRKRPTRAS